MTLVSNDAALVAGALVWLVIVVWMRKRGWTIYRNYMAAAQRKPMSRTGFVWTVAVIGAMTLVASHQRPGAPAIILVAMVGWAASIVDVKTHRLPDKYTAVMAVGVALGWVTAFIVAPGSFLSRMTASVLGAAIWLAPMVIGRAFGGKVGMGDVKLAPVLGSMVGMVGVPAAIFSMMLTYLSAGLAALWLLFTGATSVHARIPLGPWMVGSAIAGHLLWGIIPDWLGIHSPLFL